MCQSGMGATITFATTMFEAQVTGISGGDMIREWFDSTHFGSANGTDFNDIRWMEQCPGDLASMSDIVVEIIHDLEDLPPIDQPAEVITIQAAPLPGDTQGPKLVFTGGMKQYNGASYTMRDLRRGQYTLAVSGPPEFTAGS